MADMQEAGIPVTYGYISDLHERKADTTTGCTTANQTSARSDRATPATSRTPSTTTRRSRSSSSASPPTGSRRPFFAWSLLYRDRRGWLTLVVGGLVGVVVLFAFNPCWWADPISGVERFLRSNLTRGKTIPIPVEFLGRVYDTPRESLPWYNTLAWTVLVTPVGFLVWAGGAGGVGRGSAELVVCVPHPNPPPQGGRGPESGREAEGAILPPPWGRAGWGLDRIALGPSPSAAALGVPAGPASPAAHAGA